MLGSEDGGALVMAVLWLPILLLIVVLVVDVGNWFAHRRHLQTQADAAALAAAGDFYLPGCDDAAIEQTARFYSGDETAGFNQQLGGTSVDETHMELNSHTWYAQETPVDDTAPDGMPCATKVIDVKMTETDLPLFFQAAGLFSSVDFINTHARVEIRQRERFSRALPVGVPDANPKVGRVTFIDETTGEVLGSREISHNGSQNGLAIWDNSSDPLPLTVDRDRIGVRVAFGGATSTTCGQPLVECYDAGSANGILLAHGYSMAGSGPQPNAPLARNVYLTPGTCPDPYFHDESAACTIGVHAEVDFGPCDQLPAVGAKLTARVGGSSHPMTLAGCPSGSSTSVWETNGAPATVNPDAGPVQVWLDWEETKGTQGGSTCKSTGGNNCKGSFGSVSAPLARSFAASSSRSGPIHFAQLWEGGSGWANSFERCSAVQSSCTHDLVARIGIEQSLQDNADSVDDPIVELRFGATSGSQNQALDCDPAIANLRDEIAAGCAPEYERNQGTACPSTRIALWASAPPWDCAAVETGDKTGQIIAGMNLRVHGDENPSSCVSPNNWSSFPDFDQDDPRIVPVFITPFGTFQSSGQETVPVTGLAVFYATGWDGSQSDCPTDDPSPSKSIVGHFIKYVQTINDGSAGEQLCDSEELASCVAVLTR